MPIRPENRARYPKDWKAISARIRFERARNLCECAGECGIDHHGRCNERHHTRHSLTGSTVVLTVAHLDHTPENCGDDNLKAMCQRCHNRYDAPMRRAGIARRRREALGMAELPLMPRETRFGPRSQALRDRLRLARWGADTPLERFRKKYVTTSNGCWEWQGGVSSHGYGKIHFSGAEHYAHRFAYKAFIGPIPDGLQIDHLCRNRRCVNPAHLEAVTPRENTRRGKALKSHCLRGHPLSGSNLYLSKGRRECRECKLGHVRARQNRFKAHGLTSEGRPYRYAAYLAK